MAKVMKHFARAIEYKLWLLFGYLAWSLAAHLVEGSVIAKYVTGLWWLVTLIVICFILLDVLWVKGLQISHLLYQQIPRHPVVLIASQYVLSFACVLLFLAAYTTFPWHGVGLLPDGLSWPVALNILSLSLYTTALGFAVLSVFVLLSVHKDRWPQVAALVGLGLIAYLLAFHVGPGVLTLIELTFAPMAGLTAYGEIAICDSVLHAPWQQAATNLAQVTFLLLLQGGVLTYLLSGRVDVA